MASLADLMVRIPEELKQVIGDKAEETDESLARFVTRVLADAVGRPDLAELRRRRPGRPRKATA